MKTFKLGLGATLAMAFGFAYLYVSALSLESGAELPLGVKAVLATGVVSGLMLWVWMFSDFFQSKDIGFRVLWGWLLLFLNMLAAVVYFVYVYAPREYRRAEGGHQGPDGEE
jgi:hypothetical protein